MLEYPLPMFRNTPPMLECGGKIYINEKAKITFDQGITPPL
jgi:hypothetical protein